jgi:hypothetical protein
VPGHGAEVRVVALLGEGHGHRVTFGVGDVRGNVASGGPISCRTARTIRSET